MNEDILKLADGCCKDKNFETYEFGDNELEAFYKAAFNAGIEAAEKACELGEGQSEYARYYLTQIRRLELK